MTKLEQAQHAAALADQQYAWAYDQFHRGLLTEAEYRIYRASLIGANKALNVAERMEGQGNPSRY